MSSASAEALSLNTLVSGPGQPRILSDCLSSVVEAILNNVSIYGRVPLCFEAKELARIWIVEGSSDGC